MLKNPAKTKDILVQAIRDYFEKNGPGCSAVVGISGGKDSTIVAALCVEALGKDRVFGVLLPNGIQPDIKDSRQVVKMLGIRHVEQNIQEAYDSLYGGLEVEMLKLGITPSDSQAAVNLAPRLRMSCLYDVAQMLPNGGRVMNTCNKSEDYVGYSTKFGDSAGDYGPIANLMVHEVHQIGEVLNLPSELVHKTPSDGLCGKTDEDNLGFTYAQLDKYIETGTSGDIDVDNKIYILHMRNLHKLQLMPTFEGPIDRVA